MASALRMKQKSQIAPKTWRKPASSIASYMPQVRGIHRRISRINSARMSKIKATFQFVPARRLRPYRGPAGADSAASNTAHPSGQQSGSVAASNARERRRSLARWQNGRACKHLPCQRRYAGGFIGLLSLAFICIYACHGRRRAQQRRRPSSEARMRGIIEGGVAWSQE